MLDDGHEGTLGAGALIGPNTILQLRDPVATVLGPDVLAQVLHLCGVDMPTGERMIPQRDAALVHKTLHRLFPERSRDIAIAAGAATARYICAHRIPRAARLLLRLMPAALSERMLTRAVLRHAWTFCGSGHVTAQRRAGATHFALHANPMVDPGSDEALQCHWHAAVFAELYSTLIGRPYAAVETDCCGSGAAACSITVRTD